ncbi:S1 family peptidase [Microbacterium sp. NPDC089695]|uniref:S1 family peptidase n=1 Tax=Microbacterium sp. NPDC089695 TaxID=3364198 RepID=UPI00382CD522
MRNSFTRNGWVRRSGGCAASVAVVLALGAGAFIGAPAAASEVSTETAPLDDAGYQEFVGEVIATDDAINSIAQDGEGNVVVRADLDELDAAAQAELDSYENLIVIDDEPVQALAANDIVGGAGYITNGSSLCSFGFSAWSPSGTPAIITAGHCGTAGARVERSQPQRDDAPFYPNSGPGAAFWSNAAGRSVGTFAFSQWGGPSGTPGANGDVRSVDVAAINVTNANLRLRPAVTDWTSASTGDLSTSTIAVTGIGDARVGDRIVRSGRTSGLQSGTVLEIKSWTQVCERVTPTPSGCRWVYGFRTNAPSRPGDSGGSFLRGTTAIGVLPGGTSTTSFAADLKAGLAMTGGYTLQFAVAAPAVTATSAEAAQADRVWGTGEPGATLVVDQAGVITEVPIAADGTWSFDAPEAGVDAYSLSVKRGFDVSDPVAFQ